jgi:proteasome accessory factor B
VLRQFEVEFEYRKPGVTTGELRRVQPYHLSHRENLWYLIAMDTERQALRTFALPRMNRVKVTSKRFARPEDFSPEGFFASALGVLPGTGDHRVCIRFDVEAADRIRERVWHESQQVKELPGGAVEVTMRLGALPEVEQWVLGWGRYAEVIGPAELRERVASAVTALARRYERRKPE